MADSQSILLEHLERLLRPLVRLCFRSSLKYQDILPALKRAFVTVAREEISTRGANESISRLSLMTGLQRPDVSELINSPNPAAAEGSVVTRVLGQWTGDARFRGRDGIPKKLSFEGRESEFATLVSNVSKELNVYAVLFELERLGLVTKRDGFLELTSAIHVLSADLRSAFDLLARDIADLTATVVDNTYNHSSNPDLHLKIQYDNVVQESVSELREWLLDEGTQFALRVQRKLEAYDRDLNPRLAKKLGGARVALGLFSRIEDDQQAINKQEGKIQR